LALKTFLAKLLDVGATIVALLLLASCANNSILEPYEQPKDMSSETSLALELDCLPSVQEIEMPPTQAVVHWQTRCIVPRINGDGWSLVDDRLWYLNSKGIYYLDMEGECETVISGPNEYNTTFFVDNNIWFAYNYMSAHNYEGIQEDQVSFARYDLALGKYYEYSTDIITGVNVTVLESLGKVIVHTNNKLFQYYKANDKLTEMPEYGDYVWRIAGNDKMLITYTEDSLKLYQTNGDFTEYAPKDCLPDTYVTTINIIGDEVFICWGGEGESAGVACLNTKTGAWMHCIDSMSNNSFLTPYDYTLISGYGGGIMVRENGVVYLPLMNAKPSSLLKFAFSQRQFECLYSTENRIYDAIPFQNGTIIYQYPELIFLDADYKTEYILRDVVVQELIKKSSDTFIAITEQGVFECKYVSTK